MRELPTLARLGSAALLAVVTGACASKNVPADRILYQASVRPSPPISFAALPGRDAAAQRADEATVRAWWDANRPAPGYVPAFDTAATEAARDACSSPCGGGPGGIGLGIGLGLGFGWGDGDDGWGVGLNVGLPLGFYAW